MDIIHLIIVLAVVGFALYLLLAYVPMPDPIKKVIIAIVVLVLIVFVLQFAGIGGSFGSWGSHRLGPC